MTYRYLGAAPAPTQPNLAADFLKMVTALNETLRVALIPLHPAIDALPDPPPPLPASWRQMFKDRPLDALTELFAPIQHLVERIVLRCIYLSKGAGFSTITVGIPRVNERTFNLAVHSFDMLPPNMRQWCQRMELIALFAAFAIRKPPIFAHALVQVFANDTRWVLEQLRAAGKPGVQMMVEIMKALPTPIPVPPALQTFADNMNQLDQSVKNTLNQGAQQAKQAVQNIVNSIPKLPAPPGFSGLGLWFVPAGAGAAASAAAEAAVAAFQLATTKIIEAACTPPVIVALLGFAGVVLTVGAGAATTAAAAETARRQPDVAPSQLPGGPGAKQAADRAGDSASPTPGPQNMMARQEVSGGRLDLFALGIAAVVGLVVLKKQRLI